MRAFLFVVVVVVVVVQEDWGQWETPVVLIWLAYYANNTAALRLSGWKITSILCGQILSLQLLSLLHRTNTLLNRRSQKKREKKYSSFDIQKLYLFVSFVLKAYTDVFNQGGVHSIFNTWFLLMVLVSISTPSSVFLFIHGVAKKV